MTLLSCGDRINLIRWNTCIIYQVGNKVVVFFDYQLLISCISSDSSNNSIYSQSYLRMN